jgi:hypothetical protein
VLFKRKPVQFLPPAEIEDDNAEVITHNLSTSSEDSTIDE